MDPSNPLYIIAGWFGLAPSSLLAIVLVVMGVCNAAARLIPSDATGALGKIRTIASIIGIYISSRITGGTTLEQAASAAIKTPAVASQVVAAKIEDAKS